MAFSPLKDKKAECQRTPRSGGISGRSSLISLAESTKRSAMSTTIRRPDAVTVQLVRPIGETQCTLSYTLSCHCGVFTSTMKNTGLRGPYPRSRGFGGSDSPPISAGMAQLVVGVTSCSDFSWGLSPEKLGELVQLETPANLNTHQRRKGGVGGEEESTASK